MKKILLVLLPLTMIATVAAASDKDYYVYAERGASAANEAVNDFNGMYLKLASGLALPSVTTDNVGYPAPIQVPAIGAIGVSHVWNQFYLGGEAQFGYNFVTQKSAYPGYGTNANFEAKWQTMATIQLGGVISQTNVIYADAGYAFADFSYAGDTKQKSFYNSGPVVGVGASLQLADHVNFDMNYHFVYYLNKSTDLGDTRAKQNIITAGISFHF